MQTGSNLRAFLEGEKAAFLLDFEDARKSRCAKRSASERAEAAVAHNNWPDSGSQLNARCERRIKRRHIYEIRLRELSLISGKMMSLKTITGFASDSLYPKIKDRRRAEFCPECL